MTPKPPKKGQRQKFNILTAMYGCANPQFHSIKENQCDPSADPLKTREEAHKRSDAKSEQQKGQTSPRRQIAAATASKK